MEQVLDDSTFSDKSSDDAQTAKDISSSISNKLEKYKLLLAKSKSAIEAGVYIILSNMFKEL